MIGAAVEALRPLPHRLQTVGRLGRILFVDDSKATTPASARAALESFGEPVVLIAGGYDKKTNPGPMVEAALARAKAVILMGETAPALAAAFGDRGPPVHRAGGIEDAVGRAVGLAASGDVVLLAPGHASWDMFDNYEQRGDAFRRAAEALGMTPASAECEVRSAE
jgi:UDP-N-acetylmuramoylalanine--D-glutamate ligase